MSKAEGTGDRAVKGVIFDLDNTLVNFVEAKLKACEAVVDHLGRDDPEELFYQFLDGDHHIEDPQNIKDYLQSNNIFDKDLFERCSDIYRSTKLKNIELYPGVKDVLEELHERGLKIGLVTDAESVDAMDRLKKVGLLDLFDAIVTFDDTGKKKPDPEPFLRCLDEMGSEPEEVVLVGDSLDRDVVPGKELGMVTVHAKYGDENYKEEREVEADHSIGEVGGLMDVLQ
ncbi:MAG: HAD family hydrolase [Thermoplasmatota archaeon]